MELCGGTHAQAAGDIGFFKIVQETGIAAGVRRIEAVTGARALETVQVQDAAFDKLAQLLKSDRGQLAQRVVKLLDRQKELERAVETLQARLNAGRTLQLLNQVTDISGVKLLAARVDGLEGKQLRELSDQLRERLGSGVIVLGCVADGKANLLVAVTPDLTARVQAGTLIRPLAEAVGGRGGGRSDLAQAGGSDPGQLDAALARAPELLAAQLA
jgi:alanyl-tRNA synthetase